MESRLRIDAYRILASSVTIEGIDAYEDELRDRFGPPPEQVEALLLEARIRCLAEEASFDLVETKGTELFLRFAKKGPAGERTYYRTAGRLPRLKAKKSLLKLNEIIQFLKIYIHGKIS